MIVPRRSYAHGGHRVLCCYFTTDAVFWREVSVQEFISAGETAATLGGGK